MGDGDFVDRVRTSAWLATPAVTFGVRAAALAGLVITAGAATAVAFGAFDDPTAITTNWPGSTTCCGNRPDSITG
ncbi:hypothetical protein [Actinokineospora diospyrosa]|nr:hypothetical protein [Actinokineospora diospyrosa]